MNSQAFFFRLACVVGGLGVIVGAFGAHGLESIVTEELLETFEVGVRYHFYHGLALFALAIAPASIWRSPWAARAGWLWMAGIVVFSGSLYLLALTGMRWLGAITPIGGVAMIAGWFALLPAARGLTVGQEPE